MKPAVNTSVSDTKNLKNPKTASFLWKIWHLKSTAMAAVAALGLASSVESAGGTPVTLGTWFAKKPDWTPLYSSVSDPTKIGWLAVESGLSGNQNSYLLDTNRRHSDVTNSRFTINLAAADIGTSGGILTITGTFRMSTSTNFNIIGNPGQGWANLPYDLAQTIKWGNNIGTLSQIGNQFNIDPRTNDGTLDFTTAEAYLETQPFSATIPISAGGGTFYMDHEFMRSETTGAATLEGFTFSYIKNDANTNGILDTWEMTNFGVLSPADGDPDNDGMNNLMEYALNTDPKKAGQNPAVCGFEVIGGQKYLCMTFPKNPDATNINYTVESSQNLQTWLPDTTSVTTSTTQEKVRSTLSAVDAPQMFLRIKVVPK